MNAQTRVSAKGQVVIPKEMRDRLRLGPGRILDVVETPQGILLRPREERERISVEEGIRRIREIIKYDGPALTIEEMNEAIREGWIEAAKRSDCARD